MLGLSTTAVPAAAANLSDFNSLPARQPPAGELCGKHCRVNLTARKSTAPISYHILSSYIISLVSLEIPPGDGHEGGATDGPSGADIPPPPLTRLTGQSPLTCSQSLGKQYIMYVCICVYLSLSLSLCVYTYIYIYICICRHVYYRCVFTPAFDRFAWLISDLRRPPVRLGQ